MKRFRDALATGLVGGALWGVLEAAVHLLLTALRTEARHGLAFWPEPADVVAVLALAAVRYAAVATVLMVLAAAGLALVGRWIETGGRTFPRILVTVAVALNLFWWGKPWFAFTWGLPFHHPKRLAMNLVWLAAGWLVAVVLIRRRDAVPGRAAVVAVAILLAVGGGWAALRESRLTGFAERPAPGGDPPNVLMVVVDALRADRLGCYGYDERDPPVSPHVDALAEEGVLFERAVAQAPFTWTSFGSFLTGKYPRQHGLMNMAPNQRLDPARNRTLAESLADEGYVCGAFLMGTLSHNSGLLSGFDTYFEALIGHEPVTRSSQWSILRAELLLMRLWNKVRQALDPRLVNTEAMRWIADLHERPFFAMVHYYATHTPYDPPNPHGTVYDPDYEGVFHPFTQSLGKVVLDGKLPFDARDLEHVEALYDGGVRFADEMFGDLLDQLDALGIADETLVVFTSDHGEELYDHRVFEHDWMFNTNLLVPLVMRLPDRAHAGTRVSWPVEMIDLPVTVLDVAGVGDLGAVAGRSLLADLERRAPPADERWTFSENNRYVAMQGERWKLIVPRDEGGRVRVFDLANDPGETRPLDDPALLAELRGPFDAYDASMPAIETVRSRFEADPELAERLSALGYMQGYLGPNERREEDLEVGGAGDGER